MSSLGLGQDDIAAIALVYGAAVPQVLRYGRSGAGRMQTYLESVAADLVIGQLLEDGHQ